jgi:protease I
MMELTMTVRPIAWIGLVGAWLAFAAHAVPTEPHIGAVSERPEQADPVHAELLRFLLEAPDDEVALRGTRVAILAIDGVDGFDLEVPRRYLTDRGAAVDVIVPRTAPRAQRVLNTMNPSGEEDMAAFDRYLDEVDPAHYQALYLPGHRADAGTLQSAATISFVRAAVSAGRPVFAIGNAPLLLLHAGLLEHKRATGDAATFLRLALSNAAATDAPLVEDGSIYTSRDAFDMPLLMREMVSELRRRAGNSTSQVR